MYSLGATDDGPVVARSSAADAYYNNAGQLLHDAATAGALRAAGRVNRTDGRPDARVAPTTGIYRSPVPAPVPASVVRPVQPVPPVVTHATVTPTPILPPAPDAITSKLNPVVVAAAQATAAQRVQQAATEVAPVVRAIARDDARRSAAVLVGEMRRTNAQHVFRQAGVKADEQAHDASLARRHIAELTARKAAVPTVAVAARVNGKLVAVPVNANPKLLAASAAAAASSERDDAPAIVRAATAPSAADAAAAAATGTGRADPAAVATATYAPALASVSGKTVLIGAGVLALFALFKKGRR